jgi:NADH-quinone oxidoreductase subunit M
VILGAIYMLHLVGKVIWGPLKFPQEHGESHSELPVDIGARETAILVPLAVLVIVIGVLPTHVMEPMNGPVEMIQAPLALAPARPPTRTAPPVRNRPQRPAVSLAVPEAR